MADIVTAEVRSRMMRGIRHKNSKPELTLRSALHKKGFRYRLHVKALAGKPDLVFPSRNAVLFVHGCFWHGHECHLYRTPTTRQVFWLSKIATNRASDLRAVSTLSEAGWRVGIVWECALRGVTRLPLEAVIIRCAEWLNGVEGRLEIRGEVQPA
jgi:DNA mismatch endonuclease (patch repair protein)